MRRTLKYRLGLAFLTLCLLAGSAPALVNASSKAIPAVIIFRGTKYIDCRVDPDYPFAAGVRTSILRGKVGEDSGTKMYPWHAAVVGGRALFAANTGVLIDNYWDMVGTRVRICGYPGSGKTTVISAIYGDTVIDFPKACFVSEIKGWLHVCGRPVNADTGIAGADFAYFWIKEP